MTFSSLLTVAAALFGAAHAYDPDFVCLGDDATKVYFQNRNDTLVPDLWQVRVMFGGYGTQFALNYAAYMFMREKLGINVTLYPDPSTYDYYWTDAIWGDGFSEYPHRYWSWLRDDYMDVEFEYWNIQEVRGDAYSYYAEGSVIDGFVGVFGEISYWIPKYFVEAHPTVLIPEVLKTDPTIRGLLINGSIYGGSTNWAEAYGVNGSHRTYATSWDIPDGTKPIVWGSSDVYTQTDVAWGMSRTIAGGMDLHVVSTARSGELALVDVIRDLYEHRAPFIANIYIPDDNFAVVDNATVKYQNFEKMAFPRNPNQVMSDPCITNRTCQYPVDPLKKAANARLRERFPEAYRFFTAYRLEATQMGDVMRHYHKVNRRNPGFTEHEKWLHASCNWLKDPVSTAAWNNSNWLIPINRWDCVPGCGKMVEEGAMAGTYFGGTCDYATKRENVDEGTCGCDFDELYGTYCDQSCPGLVGPYHDGSGLKFDWCSGHGTCDTTNFLCDCEKGFGGKGCQTKYEKYKFPLGLGATIAVLSGLLAAACIGCIVWLRLNAQYKTVKALSINLTTIFSCGLVMIACSNIALVSRVNNASCIAWQWLFGLGGILSIMSPLLKAYRVSRVFHGGKMLRAVKITDKMLMQMLIKAACIEALVCIGYTVAHEVFGGTQTYYNDDELREEPQCNDNQITQLLSVGSYAYFVVMLCALTYYSYGTRRALSVFKESTCAYSSSFLSMFCTLITIAFYAATDDPTFRNTVQAVAIIIVVGAVLGLFYGTRIYKFFADPESRNVTDNRAPTYTSSSTTGPTSTNVMASPSNNGPSV